MWFYKYKVKYYCEIKNEVVDDGGIICNSSYSMAAETVAQYYDEDAIIELKLEQCGECENLLTLDDIKSAFKET